MKNTGKKTLPAPVMDLGVGQDGTVAHLIGTTGGQERSAKPLPNLLPGHTHGLRNLLIIKTLQASMPMHVIAMSSVPLIYTLFPT
jgi:hypothetical protein